LSVVVFEDDGLSGFGPLTSLRHVSQLRWGTRTLLDSVSQCAPDSTDMHLWGRDGLADVTREALRAEYNETPRGQALLVNAVAKPGKQLRSLLEKRGSFAAFSGDRLVAARLSLDSVRPGVLTKQKVTAATRGVQKTHIESGYLFAGYWNLVESNGLAIAEQAKPSEDSLTLPSAAEVRGPPSNLMVDARAEVEQFVTFDTRQGPIVIEGGTQIESFSRVAGPCYVGPRTRLFSAQVGGGTSIFEGCRVGGQVDNSVIMPHTNKAHLGYVGDSYVGEWINIGAGSNFSNLKNTYGNVRLHLEGKKVDSGMLKLGPAVGDLCKLSIGSLVYSGKMLGIGSQVGGAVSVDVPAFTYLGPRGKMVELLIDSVVETQRRMMERRGETLTRAGEALVREAFRLTSAERRKAGARKGRLG
jgi:UDP-N-acetylglucosamine diphosphorylase/glucosamine-1-phosphate N-acetyltransferase